MNSLSEECKKHRRQIDPAIGRPWHPLPHEHDTIDVYVYEDGSYEIDTNIFDVVDTDRIIFDFFLDESWDMHTEIICAVDTERTVEAFRVVDRRLVLPRRHVLPGKLKLTLFGFFEPKVAGCRLIDGYFVMYDDIEGGYIEVGGNRFVATETHDKTMRSATIYIDPNGHYIASSYMGITRPKEYDEPISEENPSGYRMVELHDIPIEIGSWYDR